VKWLSDALPVLILAHYEYDDPNEGETKDEEGNPLPTLADLEKGTWGESSSLLYVFESRFIFSLHQFVNDQIYLDYHCWMENLVAPGASLMSTQVFVATWPMTLTSISSSLDKRRLFS